MRARGRRFSLLFFCACAPIFAQSAENLFQAANGAFAEKLYLIAAENYESLVELFPDHPLADDADYLRAVAGFYRADFRACLAVLASYPQKYPGSENLKYVHYWRGSSFYRLGEPAAAVRELSLQIDGYPAEESFLGHSLLLRGLALEATSEPEAAAESYRTLLGLSAAREMHPEALYRLGGIAFARGELRQALVSLSRLLLDFPGSRQAPEALFLAAECYFYLERDGEAEKRYRRILADDPGSRHRETVLFQLFRLLGRSGRGEEALALARELEKAFPEGRYGREMARLEGDLLFDLKRYPEAWAVYEEAYRRESDQARRRQIAFNLGLAYLRGGETEKALSPLRRAAEGPEAESEAALFELGAAYGDLGRSGEAAAALEQFLLRYHASARREQALWLLGSVYEESDAFGRAAEIFSSLLTYYPDSPRSAEYLFKRGSASLSGGNETGALEDFFTLVTDFPASPFVAESRYNIGYVYSRRGEYRRALPFFQAAAQDAEHGADAALVTRAELAEGSALFNLGQYEAAAEIYRRLAARDGGGYGREEAWFGLGRSYYKLERFQEAEESFEAACAAFAGTAAAAEPLYWQGVCAFRLGALERAAELFMRLAEDHPGSGRSGEALFRAGSCVFQLRDYATALERFDRALLRLGTRNTLGEEILYQKGWCLVELGRRPEAERVFETLAGEYAGSLLAPEAFFQLGEADFKAGEPLAALKLFERVLTAYPGSQAGQLALYWAGKSAAAAGRTDTALGYYLDYMERFPEGSMIEPLGEEVVALLAGRNDPAAVQDFYLQVEGNPGFPRSLKNRVRTEYARLLLASERVMPERLEEAALLLQAIRRSAPEEPLKSEVNFLVGDVYQRRGELDRAADIFSGLAAVRADRLGAEAQLRVAAIHESRGNAEKAAEEYLKVYFLYPDYPDLVRTAIERSSALLESLGETEKAEKLRARLP
jgi:TolA-binding protein